MMNPRFPILLLLCLPFFSMGQNDMLAPTLVSSAGGYNMVGGVSLAYSVGEPVVTTLQVPAYPNAAAFYLTQGFHQPEMANMLNIDLTFNNESCLNSKDGSANVAISGGVPPYTVTWSSDSADNNASIDSLMPGAYTVIVKDANGHVISNPFVIAASETACQIKIYTGITPNGDGQNDTWIIGNIELYPQNSVSIYNRWGTEVWSANGYDNNKVVWSGLNAQGQPLPDGTYFYLVTINGATPLKGWVQLTR